MKILEQVILYCYATFMLGGSLLVTVIVLALIPGVNLLMGLALPFVILLFPFLVHSEVKKINKDQT